MGVTESTVKRYYPNDRRNGTKFFYSWIEGSPDASTVLNLGAGPGDQPGHPSFGARDLRREGRTVHGCDVDLAVLTNPQVDEPRVITENRLPYCDEFFDLVYSDYVLEHVDSPSAFLAEVVRVLRPGGAFYFRTPNRFHYVAVASALTPHWVHSLVANRARALGPRAHHPYPTYYRMNTARRLRGLGQAAGFSRLELVMFEGEPSYLAFASGAFLLGVAYERLVNRYSRLAPFRSNIMGRFEKGE